MLDGSGSGGDDVGATGAINGRHCDGESDAAMLVRLVSISLLHCPRVAVSQRTG